MRATIFVSCVVAALIGCGPGDVATEGGEETGGDESPVRWAEIRCIDVPSGVACFGRPDGAADSWVSVRPSCELDEVDGQIPTWGDDTCAPGLVPDPVDWGSTRCFSGVFTQGSLCFGESGGWATGLLPLCTVEQGDLEPWPDSVCATTQAGMIGEHPWDDVWCLDNACFAELGGALLAIVPTCWLDERTAAPIPNCT